MNPKLRAARCHDSRGRAASMSAALPPLMSSEAQTYNPRRWKDRRPAHATRAAIAVNAPMFRATILTTHDFVD